MLTDGSDIRGWAKSNRDVIWIDDIPWFVRNKLLLPLSMPHTIKYVDRKKVREALISTNSLLAHWSDEWDCKESEWWWTCCDDRNYDIENIKNPSGRRGIRKGISACSVHRIEAKNFSNLAYNIYSKSLKSYGLNNLKIPTEEQYNKEILEFSEYEGYELWGAFVNGRLAAFATCTVVNNAVSLGSTKSDPDMHKYYPNNALFYHVTRHYLKERGILYVTNGTRTLLHPTTINDFLIRMGYRRIFCRLNIELSTYSKLMMSIGIEFWEKQLKIFSRLFPNQWVKFKALLELNKISKTF